MRIEKAVPISAAESSFSGDSTGVSDISAALQAAVIANVDPTTGISLVTFGPGKYLVNWAPDTSVLYAAGVRKVILAGTQRDSVRFYHNNTNPAITWDNSGRTGTAQVVSDLSLQSFSSDVTNRIHRLTIPTVTGNFAKNDIVNVFSADVPEYSNARVVGETFRLKDIDAGSNFLWADGRLEYALDSLYTTNILARKLDQLISIDIYNISFYANGDSTDLSITTRSHTLHYTAAVGCVVQNCYFEAPWEISWRLVTCADCEGRDCFFKDGLNNPASNQLTYGMQFYGACFNCWMVDSKASGYRHLTTTDGNSGASTTVQTPFFTTVNTSPTVTVTRSSHSLVVGDYVYFPTSQAGNNVTISGKYAVASIPTSGTFTITAGTNANASSSFGSGVAMTKFRASQWAQYGQPVYCGAKNCHATETKGAPFDTHEEGANIQYINCTAHNTHSSDELSAFTGEMFQVRCRRVILKGCMIDIGNYCMAWKPGEQGAQNWLKIIDSTFQRTTFPSDNGYGILISAGTGALVNTPRLFLENVEFNECGTSINAGIAVLVEGVGVKSIRPHIGHFLLTTGSAMNMTDLYWDSRSANLPGAATANRTLFGVRMSGTCSCRIAGMTHVLGTDTTKHTPNIFQTGDSATGKTIKLIGYKEIDPSGIGARTILKTGDEANFTVEAIICAQPRVRIHTAAGAATVLQEDDILIIKKTVGAATTVNYTPISYKPQTIKDGKRDAATNNITLTPSSGNIEGAATFVMNVNGQSVSTIHDGTEGNIV